VGRLGSRAARGAVDGVDGDELGENMEAIGNVLVESRWKSVNEVVVGEFRCRSSKRKGSQVEPEQEPVSFSG